jgi:hypothetical protein
MGPAEHDQLMGRRALPETAGTPVSGIPEDVAGSPFPITASRMGHLQDALSRTYDVLGFGRAAGGDEVFRQLVLARIIEPTSKLDSLRVLDEAGLSPPSHATVKRRPVYAKESWRQQLAAACAAHAGSRSFIALLFRALAHCPGHGLAGLQDDVESKDQGADDQPCGDRQHQAPAGHAGAAPGDPAPVPE